MLLHRFFSAKKIISDLVKLGSPLFQSVQHSLSGQRFKDIIDVPNFIDNSIVSKPIILSKMKFENFLNIGINSYKRNILMNIQCMY